MCGSLLYSLYPSRLVVLYTRYAVGDIDASEGTTTPKSETSNTHYTLRDSDPGEETAVSKSTVTYTRHTVGDNDADEGTAALENTVTNNRHTVGESNLDEGIAARKCSATYTRYTVGDGDCVERFAAFEGLNAYRLYTVRNCYRSDAKIFKSTLSDRYNRFGDYHIRGSAGILYQCSRLDFKTKILIAADITHITFGTVGTFYT